MNELPASIKRKINRYEPVETEGLTLYPIRVDNYFEFRIATMALGFMTQALPIEYMSMPVLSTFYKIDYEHAMKGEPSTGLFSSALVGLVLALRLNQDDDTADLMAKRIVPFCDPVDPTRLVCLKFIVDGTERKTITPIQYASIRQIIAAQNGVVIPDELDNPELVKAEEDIQSAKSPRLEYKVENLVGAAAALSGKEEAEIYEWPILKLTNRLATFKRLTDYVICGIGESQGTTWKGGNPHPHPWLDKEQGMSDAAMPIENFLGGRGVTAMQEAGVNVTSA